MGYYYYDYNPFGGLIVMTWLIAIIVMALAVVGIIGKWKAYTKMGLPGWAVLIPIYNRYVLFKMYYGKGWKLIYEWIPFYGTYVNISLSLRIAKSFKEDGGFGWGLALLSTLFWIILGFNKDTFDGPVSDVAGRWLKSVIRDAMKGNDESYSEESDPVRKAWKEEQAQKAAQAAQQAQWQAQQQAQWQAQQQAQWQAQQQAQQPQQPVTPPPAPQTGNVCPKCGASNAPEAGYCVNCGTKLN
ncbi:MAG: zinc ribbon domain-containing protein [Lachnospiraceae bacterium]|nr:zinc ribbon domain-containing protein [Lachnospiraceae bacterium]